MIVVMVWCFQHFSSGMTVSKKRLARTEHGFQSGKENQTPTRLVLPNFVLTRALSPYMPRGIVPRATCCAHGSWNRALCSQYSLRVAVGIRKPASSNKKADILCGSITGQSWSSNLATPSSGSTYLIGSFINSMAWDEPPKKTQKNMIHC